jgi:hypothetical protein
MIRLAALTAIAAVGEDQDLAPLAQALARRGIALEELAWDDPTVSWRRFAAVLIRSPWDYSERHKEFFPFLRRLAAAVPLLNPYPLLAWNLDKRYLAELAAAGVATIPTRILERTEDWPETLPAGEWVLKPAIGAGSRGARRFPAAQAAAMRAHAEALLRAGRGVLLQPYLAEIEAAGETALVYFAGRYSHAIRKRALLPQDGEAVRALYNPERIARHRPSKAEKAAGERVLAFLRERFPEHWPPLYARVDLIPARGGPLLLELALAEPSLFLDSGRGAAARMAAALAAALEKLPAPALG